LHPSPDIIRVRELRRMRRVKYMTNAHKISVRKPEGKRQLGRPWDDNIKFCLKETGCESVDWILVEDSIQQWALQNRVINLLVP
jgi:hypothetical protein